MSGNDDQKQKLVEVDDVDASGRRKTNESVQMDEGMEVDRFIEDGSNIDSQIRKDMMKSSRYSYMAGDHGLTINQGCLAILSTCVGGGIVGLPLAMYNLGIPLAIFLQILVMFSTHASSYLYLGVKDIVPDKPDSLYEIGYMILGRSSIFVLASIFIINSFGLCMIYFIVFGDTAGQLAASFTDGDYLLGDIYYTSRWFYSVPLAGVLLPIVLKKELAELAWISVVLFVSLTLFVLMSFVMLVFDSNFEPLGVDPEILTPKVEWGTISALSVTMLAYSYQQNVFPIYSELKNKTNEEYSSVSKRALPLTASIYFSTGIICCLMFGSGLESSVLLNIGKVRKADGSAFWEAYIIQVSFMLVLMCHIPFIFFSGKEAVLIVIDEISRKSISSALWHKLQNNNHFSMAPEHQEVPNPDLPVPGDNTKEGFQSLVLRNSAVSDMKNGLAQSRMRSQAITSHISAAVAQRLAYREMNIVIYLIASISFYGVIVLLAMLLEDISSVFDFVSAYSISGIAFFIPAIFMRKGVKKFNIDQSDPDIQSKMKVALLFIPLGCLNAVLGISSAIITITGLADGGH